MFLLSSADFFFFFFKKLFQKIISGILLKCQMVWIKIRTDNLSVLIWVQTVCKGYQQTTKVAASKETVSKLLLCMTECVLDVVIYFILCFSIDINYTLLSIVCNKEKTHIHVKIHRFR